MAFRFEALWASDQHTSDSSRGLGDAHQAAKCGGCMPHSVCSRVLSISNIDLTHPIPVKYIGVSKSNHSVFATYVLLWTTQPYSWEDAEAACKDMDLHLASVSSEEEYFIVKGMLKGEEYQVNQTGYEVSPVTPCKLSSPLCVVHIGMQTKV